jgi:CMP-N-acetylneuraminic acid synthetase
MTHIIALVPMRHHSQRVPGKNYRLLAGKPLYQHIIETLRAVPEIDGILVDTDSQPILAGLQRDFPQVQVIDRPEHLRADTIPMNDILLYDTSQVEADFYLQTHSTNPLISPETVSKAIQTFLVEFPAHDSLFSVTRLQTRLYDQQGHALNHDPKILLQTQDLPPVYEENSCLYIINAEEAWDIDDEMDFRTCDLILSNRLSGL